MRYSVISKGLTISQLQDEVRRCGGRNLKVASASKQIFCDLEPATADKLKAVPGLSVKEVQKSVTTPEAQQRIASPPVTPLTYPDVPIYAASLASAISGFYDFRNLLTPPATGSVSTICILDSGIRKTHEGLRDKVVYEANFSDSPTIEDIFDHGTAVAFCAAGGRHSVNEESGAAPGAYLWNIKVLGDGGSATDEQCVLAIEHCIEKRMEALARGLPEDDPLVPNILNISWGAPDDGDPDSPIRVACRAADEIGLRIFAAAGNFGPGTQTIMLPATDPKVWAVGAATFYPSDVWEYSSRGPSLEGIIKPDMLFYGVRIVTASCKSDDAFVIKSGTSFASPFISGVVACATEGMVRVFEVRGVTPEEAWQYAKEYFAAAAPGLPLTVKPAGAPAEKDNTYGYGMPNGELWGRALAPTMDIGSMLANLTPLIGIAMMGMIMVPMAKGIR